MDINYATLQYQWLLMLVTHVQLYLILEQTFVTVLRAKGLSERKILFRHVIKNSAIPLVTVFLPMFIGTATGSIFVEAMFRVPGLGAYFVSSIENKDYPLEMSLLLMITVMFVLRILLPTNLRIIKPTYQIR